MKKYGIIGSVAILLVAGVLLSVHHRNRQRDIQLSQNVVGSWVVSSSSLNWTLNPNGTYVAKFVTREGAAVDYEGTWKIKDGSLIMILTANNSMNTKHTLHVGATETYKIIHADDQELVSQEGEGVTAVTVRFTKNMK